MEDERWGWRYRVHPLKDFFSTYYSFPRLRLPRPLEIFGISWVRMHGVGVNELGCKQGNQNPLNTQQKEKKTLLLPLLRLGRGLYPRMKKKSKHYVFAVKSRLGPALVITTKCDAWLPYPGFFQ